MSQFILYDCEESSIEDISSLMKPENKNITTLRIVNSDYLKNLKVIQIYIIKGNRGFSSINKSQFEF